jgi:hypothetical protein
LRAINPPTLPKKNKFVVFWVVKKNGCFGVGGSISIEQQASNQMIGKLDGGGMERRDRGWWGGCTELHQ